MPRLWVQGYHRGRAVDSDPGEIIYNREYGCALEYVYA